MATNVTNNFFQRLPTFIWLVFGHTISVQRLYTFYEVFVVYPSCFQSLILHLHSYVSKPDELCKEQKLLNIYMFYIIVNFAEIRPFININLCLKYIIKNLHGLISEFLDMNNIFWFQRKITCLVRQFLFPTLYFRWDLRLVSTNIQITS